MGLEGWGDFCRQRLGLLAQMVACPKAGCVASVLDWVRMSLGTMQGSGSYTWLCFSLLENFFTNLDSWDPPKTLIK